MVSSGAIALARRSLGLTAPRLRLEEKQAAASVGQIRLAQAWSEALSAHGMTAAQLLLTLDDTEDRRRYLNARATLTTLLGPWLRAGHQRERQRGHRGDPLRRQRSPGCPGRRDGAGRPARSAVGYRWPLYRRSAPRCRRPPFAAGAVLTEAIERMGGDPPLGYSSGGMRTKLVAARIAMQAGCAMAIALGRLVASPAGAGTGRTLHLVPAGPGWPFGAQALDPGQPAAARRAGGRCRRRARAGLRQIPAARRRPGRGGQFWARRSGCGARPGRQRPGARASAPMPMTMPPASSATARRRSKPFSAGAAATRSSTATTWCSYERPCRWIAGRGVNASSGQGVLVQPAFLHQGHHRRPQQFAGDRRVETFDRVEQPGRSPRAPP